jgi:UDP-3-O-[3-hydroxymyristoyl] glucosamine N-acyltransferase
MSKLALVGGGGFAKEVHEIATVLGHDIVGYFGREQSPWELHYLGAPEVIPQRATDFEFVALAFGAVDRTSIRKRMVFAKWLSGVARIAPALISPHAVVGRGAIVREGAFVAHNVVLGPDSYAGPFTLINTAVSVGHDARIDFGAILSPHCFVGGQTSIGAGSLVGPGVQILQGLEVGSDVVLGLGASVFRNVPDASTIWPPRMAILKA